MITTVKKTNPSVTPLNRRLNEPMRFENLGERLEAQKRGTIDLQILEPSRETFNYSPLKHVDITKCEVNNDNITLELQIETEPQTLHEILKKGNRKNKGKNILKTPIRFVEEEIGEREKRKLKYESIHWRENSESLRRRERRLKEMTNYANLMSKNNRLRTPEESSRGLNNRRNSSAWRLDTLTEFKRPPRRESWMEVKKVNDVKENRKVLPFESFGRRTSRGESSRWRSRDRSSRRERDGRLWANFR